MPRIMKVSLAIVLSVVIGFLIGDFPGTLWGVHGMSVDQEGNLYVAEVDAGRVQKFRPRTGANPAYLMSRPLYVAWQ